jgi:arylformamidase
MQVIDLSLEVSEKLRVFPGSPQPLFMKWTKFDVHSYDSEIMLMSTHTGTHLDAPSHFVADSQSVDVIAVERFVCTALLLRVPKHANELITLEEIENIKEIDQGIATIFDTGWNKMATNDDYMTSNPGLSKEAAEFLVEKKVNAVGIDSPSIDTGIERHFTCHNALLSSGILIVENLCNLDRFESKAKFTLLINPLKLRGASGSPIRALAVVP